MLPKAIATVGDVSNLVAMTGLFLLAYGIMKLIENWKDLSDWAKIVNVVFLGVIGTIVLLTMVCKAFNLTIMGRAL